MWWHPRAVVCIESNIEFLFLKHVSMCKIRIEHWSVWLVSQCVSAYQVRGNTATVCRTATLQQPCIVCG